jgi:hypothetical protein
VNAVAGHACEVGSAPRDRALAARTLRSTVSCKKGAHGGNMVSPVLNRPEWVRIPVAGIQRLIEQAAATP